MNDLDRAERNRLVEAARTASTSLTQWPLLVTLAVVAVGAVVTSTGHWRRGSFIIGCGMALAAVLRAVLPARIAGLLVVRSRWFDVVLTGLLAAGILALTLVVPPSRPR